MADFPAFITLFESENERQKIEPVPIPLPRASRNFPDGETRNDFLFHNWTSEIIPLIRFGIIWFLKKNLVSCFDIGDVPRSPGKRNWNWLYFLPFIFTFEQGEVSIANNITIWP